MGVNAANEFFQSDQIALSRLLLAQLARQQALFAEERRYVSLVISYG